GPEPGDPAHQGDAGTVAGRHPAPPVELVSRVVDAPGGGLDGRAATVPCPETPGSLAGHPASPEPPLADLVEFCSTASLTPSTSRRRCSVSATSDWLVAHPLIRNTGTLPGGVAELAVELDAAAPPAPADDAPEEEPEP